MTTTHSRHHWYLCGYTCFLIVVLLGNLLQPGVLLTRDMVVLDHPALNLSALGFGDLPARNAPQDGFLALAGLVLPASWLVRGLLFATASIGAWAAYQLAQQRGPSKITATAAITITLWNPFIIERLLQGHWSVALAAWLIPALLYFCDRPRSQTLVLWIISLTPTGTVLGTIIAVISNRQHRLRMALTGALLSLPWLIPSLISPPTASAHKLFIGRSEAFLDPLTTFITLGGIWNNNAVPDSRHHGWVLAGLALFAILIWHMPRRWAITGGVAIALYCALWLGPAEWVFAHLPGAALFRDSHKLTFLLIPGYITAATRISNQWLAGLATGLALLQIPDAPIALNTLSPLPAQHQWHTPDRTPGDLLNLDSHGLITYHGRVLVDPLNKAESVVESGQLIVDTHIADPASPRHQLAVAAWHNRDTTTLAHLGISQVLVDGSRITIPHAAPSRQEFYFLGLFFLSLWCAVPIATVWLSFSKNRRPVSSQE